jgi:hypothetical protein
MAKLYGLNNAVDFAAKNLINFTSIFARSAGQPLDKTAVWYPAYVDTTDNWSVVASTHAQATFKTGLERATQYAASGAAYVGQEIAVIDVIYAENGTDVENTIVTIYSIQDANGTLKEVGVTPVGDGESIVVAADGTVSLKGIDGLTFTETVTNEDGETETVEVIYQPLMTNAGLVWVKPSKHTAEELDLIIEQLISAAGDLDNKADEIKSELEATIATEAQAREAADTTEKEAREAADNAEAQARREADEAEATAREAADKAEKEAREQAISDEATARANAIKAEEAARKAADEKLSGDITAALEAAKKYADDEDASIEASIVAIQTDLSADGNTGKAIAQNAADIVSEANARAQGDAGTLTAAKAYTDEEIVGLDIILDKKTVEGVESDYLIIKNKAGAEVASVNAAKLVKDGMLDSVNYDTTNKKLTLTWNTDAGKNATEISLNDLIDTYVGSDHIDVSSSGVISIKSSVALQSDITSLNDSLTAIINTKRTEAEVDTQIDAKITAANLSQYAKAADVESALDTKLAIEDYNKDVAAHAEVHTALNTSINSQLDTKVDKTVFEQFKTEDAAAKATYATKAELQAAETTLGNGINDLDTRVTNDYYTKTEIDNQNTAYDQSVAAKYETIANVTATKNALQKSIDDNKSAADASFTAVGSRIDTLNGEVVKKVQIGTKSYDPTNNLVNISVDDISGQIKVEKLNDGQALLDRVSDAEANIVALAGRDDGQDERLGGHDTALTALSTRVTDIETEIGEFNASRIDDHASRIGALESTAGNHETRIGAAEAAINRIDGEVAGLTDTKANKADVYTKTDINSKVETINGEIADINTDLTGVHNTIDNTILPKFNNYVLESTFTSYVESNDQAISNLDSTKANKADVYTKGEVYTKAEADAEFMTEAEVDARIDTLVGGANNADSIAKLVDLVNYVNENAADIATLVSDVATNKTDIATNKTNIAANLTKITEVEGTVTALATYVDNNKIKTSDEISVGAMSTDSTGRSLTINKVDVSKLVQEEDFILVLDGGCATGARTN